MSAPVDHDLAARLRLAEERWLDQCASRLREARIGPRAAARTTRLSPGLTRRPTGVTR